jgi:ATP-dependent Clp protease ATP-binding subunit ClpA
MDISKGELYRALGEMPEDVQPSAGISDELITVTGTSNYCRDLTSLASAGKLDPAIGYDDKMIEILQILVRRHRSNPILVGPDGVGKSALFRGFAQSMADGKLLGEMKAKRLLLLDTDEITSGIKYRGELEERFKTVLQGIKESSKSSILAIDDIHELLTASPTGGPPEMVGPLKAFLSRGEVTVVASTNEEDFTRHFSLDKGLASLFQKVSIQPPTLEQALQIIEGIKASYEGHHGLKIDDEAIRESVKMSKRYLGGRMLPDVAIDVLDEAASLFRLVSEGLKDRLQNAINRIEGGNGKDMSRNLSELNDIFENCSYRTEIKSSSIVLPENPASNSDLAEPARQLLEALNTIEKKVTSDDVASTVSRWTGIPLAKMREDEAQKVLHMEKYLSRRVVGQDEAVRVISEAVRKSRAGLKRPDRPIGAFIFLGPTGTGKTELAKAIAEFLFDDEKNIVRMDMSEYMEKHNVAKLIGAPPGYVGYEEGGILTESVKRQPYSVVLFDEIEKAHLDIFNILLQLLDDGRLTDGKNCTIDFSNTIVIMTSNFGGMEIVEKDRRNESFTEEELRELMLRKFKPEILNRIQEVIVFHTLSKDSLKTIVDIQIGEVRKLLSDKKIDLRITDEAVEKLAEEGYDFEMGARPLQRLIEKEILSRLSVKIITGEAKRGDEVEVGTSGGDFRVSILRK